MEQKNIKYYDLVFQLAASDYRKRPKAVHEVFSKLIKLDVGGFMTLWEYLLIRDAELLLTPAHNQALTGDLFLILLKAGSARAFKTLTDGGEISRVLLTASAAPLMKEITDFFVAQVYNGKFDKIKPAFKLLQKNTVVPYGEFMVKLFDEFYEFNKANLKDAQIVTLKKPAARFLLEAASKIKGEGKALLTQRINELLAGRLDEE